VAFAITIGEVEGVTVLKPVGRIEFGEESDELLAKVRTLLDEGRRNLVMNMNEVTLVDSSGLSALVSAHSSARFHGASLRICHMGAQLRELLGVTCLLSIFEIYDTEVDAISSFPH
jgi:anti-sigma B factor antagonist